MSARKMNPSVIEVVTLADASCPTIRSRRAARVAEMFGARVASGNEPKEPIGLSSAQIDRIAPRAGEITLLTGASGAGKSSLFRAMRRRVEDARWIDLAAIGLPEIPVVNCIPHASIQRSLAILSRVGLAEVWTYLRTPSQLSEGQRWRLRLAMAMTLSRKRESIIACDEFAAVLDRVTASIVARCLRRAIGSRSRAIVCSSHEDLIRPLAPDVIVRCDFCRIEIDLSFRRGNRENGGS